MSGWITEIETWIEGLASSFWVYPALTGFATIDGFFPPIPSESVVITLGALAQSTGNPSILGIIIAGAIGAFCGDQIAYSIGKRLNPRQMRWFRGEKAQKSLDWAEHALENRGASFIIAARYIPIGRVAVNMTAGAVGYSRRRFMALTAIAAITWSVYSLVIGLSAGAVFSTRPLLGVVVGVIGGVIMGIIVDKVLTWWGSRRHGLGDDEAADARAGASAAGEPTQDEHTPTQG